MKNQKGFTLIELLLVLAIIGIISAIAIPALLGQREAARNRATGSNCANVKGAIAAAIGELDKDNVNERSKDLIAAVTVTDVMNAVKGRTEYSAAASDGARNPFDRTLAAYTFNALAPAVGGNVAISDPVVNAGTGYPEIQFRFGTLIKGVPKLDNQLPSLDASK